MNARFLILLQPLLLTVSCGEHRPKTDIGLCIETDTAAVAEITPVGEFPFISKPLRTSTLSFRVPGPVNHFEVYAGSSFRSGELIAEIDPRDFRLRYEKAEASCRRARADYERIAALYGKDNLPESSYEAARAEWISAETFRNMALNELNDTQLRAPFDGYVGEVFIERHQDVRASQPVMTLVDISSLRIEIYVTQEIAMMAPQLKQVELSFDHLPGRIFRAEVAECARSTTPNNLSYLFTALLPNPDGEFPAGLSGRVRFDLPGAARTTASVARKALCHRPGIGDYVWVVDPHDGKVTRRTVRRGELLSNERIEVTEGIAPGECVAVSGLRFLEEGMSVEPAGAPAQQPAQPEPEP